MTGLGNYMTEQREQSWTEEEIELRCSNSTSASGFHRDHWTWGPFRVVPNEVEWRGGTGLGLDDLILTSH